MHCLSLFSVICCAPWRLTKISYLGFDDAAGLLSKWHFFVLFFFYLENVSFLLEQTSEKCSGWYFLFLLIFTSSVVDIQEIKVLVLRPEGLWCLESVEERFC